VLFGSRTKRLIDLKEDPKIATLPIKDENELYRITEISSVLDVDEKVLLVSQSKMRLLGLPFTYYVIYATDRRLIIRDISLHGLKERTTGIPYSAITDVSRNEGLFSSCIRLRMSRILEDSALLPQDQYDNTEQKIDCIIEHIPKGKAHDLVKIVRAMINKPEFVNAENRSSDINEQHIVASFSSMDSPADELLKIARLKNEGIINEQEFIRLKQTIIERIH
jgi:hypothetical protein